MSTYNNLPDLIAAIKNSNSYKNFLQFELPHKKQREEKAWQLIRDNQFILTFPVLENFIQLIDISSKGERWFGLLLVGQNKKLLFENSIKDLNEWFKILINPGLSSEEALQKALNMTTIKGASKGLASILLYLSNPTENNIWMKATRQGLSTINLLPNYAGNNKEKYALFNTVANKFKIDYGFHPTELDWLLTVIGKHVKAEGNSFVFPYKENLDFNIDRYNKALNLYKDLIRTPNKEYRELYKWETIKNFQNNWDIDAFDFKEMFEKSFQPINNNLWSGKNYLPRTALSDFSRVFPEKVRTMFRILFDETVRLEERFIKFSAEAGRLLNELYPGKKLSHYQDQRIMALYLTLRYPEKYYFYKFNMYKDFSTIFQPNKIPVNSKKIASEFFNFCDILRNRLVEDEELLELHRKRLTESCYPDSAYTVLTQDFIYSSIKYLKDKIMSGNDDSIIKALKPLPNIGELNFIFYGPPGTGKTYKTIEKALQLIGKDKTTDNERSVEFKRNLHDQIEFITFHQNYSYEDFVQGLKPDVDNTNSLSFKLHNGIFYDICMRAKDNYLKAKSGEGEFKKYVLIIDEINRANISRVLGELITLLEPDKRIDQRLELEVKLPSGENFSVPPNLYIIGTMNTADKSIALIDIALRRRFIFIPMYVDYSPDNLQHKDILEKMNNKIIEVKGADFQIGHAYFLKNGEDFEISSVFQNKILPLLSEYFMNDKEIILEILKYAGVKTEDKNGLLIFAGLANEVQ